jgi:rubrerythrin
MLRQAVSRESRPIVAATFADRVAGEREARARFLRLAIELEATGAERAVIDLARRAADDEQRHAIAFAAWAGELGRATDPYAPFDAPRVGRVDLPDTERVLLEVVSLCCLAETVATAVLGAALDTVEVPLVKDRLHEILKDEVRHAKLGWAHLASQRAQKRGAGIAAALPAVLEAGVPLARLQTSVWPLAPELGLLPKTTLLDLLRGVLADVVFPGFERYDVDTAPARAWAYERGLARAA